MKTAIGGVGTLGNKVLGGGGTFTICGTDMAEGFGRSKVRTCGVTCDLISGFSASIGSATEIFGGSIIGLGTMMVRDRPSAIATDFTASSFGGAGFMVSSFGDEIAGDTGVNLIEPGCCESKTEDIPGGNSSSFGGVAG